MWRALRQELGTCEENYTVPGSKSSEKHWPWENGVAQRVQRLVERVLVDSSVGEGIKELRAYQDREVWQGAPQMAEFPVKVVESMASVPFRVPRILE
jgi:hypothetical protein